VASRRPDREKRCRGNGRKLRKRQLPLPRNPRSPRNSAECSLAPDRQRCGVAPLSLLEPPLGRLGLGFPSGCQKERTKPVGSIALATAQRCQPEAAIPRRSAQSADSAANAVVVSVNSASFRGLAFSPGAEIQTSRHMPPTRLIEHLAHESLRRLNIRKEKRITHRIERGTQNTEMIRGRRVQRG
jgi:hypothetical protein